MSSGSRRPCAHWLGSISGKSVQSAKIRTTSDPTGERIDKSFSHLLALNVIISAALIFARPARAHGNAPTPTPTPTGAVNPASFGAVCDGVTNDYAAFVSAVAAEMCTCR